MNLIDSRSLIRALREADTEAEDSHRRTMRFIRWTTAAALVVLAGVVVWVVAG